MAIRNPKKKTGLAGGLDSPKYQAMFQKTREAALKALAKYGEPAISLEELRRLTDASLPEGALSGQLLKDREAGW